MFDELRSSLRDLFAARLSPTDRRAALGSMKEGLVHARLAVDDLRAAVGRSQTALTREEAELATVVRRQGLAEQIGDAETVAVAQRFAAQHQERAVVLRDKVDVQQRELALMEREYAVMLEEFKRVHAGLDPAGAGGGRPARDVQREAAAEVDALLAEANGAPPEDSEQFEAMARAARRAAREASAEERLAELKARMGRGD
jgi:hypothetical protein